MDSKKIKRIDIKEFRALGFLQEANRLFFHPLGLALEAIISDDGSEKLGGLWDYRDDPEGMFYENGRIKQERIDFVDKLKKSKIEIRKKLSDVNENGIQLFQNKDQNG